MQQKTQLDKYLQPMNSPIAGGTESYHTMVAWEFGVQQGIQAKKVKASSGFFKKLSGGTASNNSISAATISSSLFSGGTVANTSIQNGTFPSGLFTGGTLNNVILGTPTTTGGTYNSGTINNAVIGTPIITGGTANAGTYQVGGAGGASGSIVYVKTVSPGTTFGTVSFTAGLVTSFN